ncbi:hypothetical protein AB0873_28565 [Micromonospora sp. NPDC047707]|uniref:hypothetical protein n=1 Tax=Micromonospora sp. NPDC047707 TaxID=3154498 RepID=UPI0034547C2D
MAVVVLAAPTMPVLLAGLWWTGCAGLVGVVLLATGRVRRGAHIPMGPFFIAGTVVMLAVTAPAAPG